VTVDVQRSYLAGIVVSPSLAFRHVPWSPQWLLRVVVATKYVLIYTERFGVDSEVQTAWLVVQVEWVPCLPFEFGYGVVVLWPMSFSAHSSHTRPCLLWLTETINSGINDTQGIESADLTILS